MPHLIPYFDNKYYQANAVCTILAEDFIYYIEDVFEISIDDYIDFKKNVEHQSIINSFSTN